MKEIISIHVGQAGIQVGQSCWQLFCLEHSLTVDGSPPQAQHSNISTFFYETPSGKYVPRSVFADLEPAVIDQLKKSEYGKIYNSGDLITGKEDGCSTYTRGYMYCGRAILDEVADRIRKQSQKCQSFEGFFIYRGLGGGTGSGLGQQISQTLQKDYSKQIKLGFNILPSPHLTNGCVEPYNTMLATLGLYYRQDLSLVFDNEALYNICTTHLDIDSPNFRNINRLIAQMASSITSSIRSYGEINTGLKDMQANLVPYKKMLFLIPSHSPFTNIDQNGHKNIEIHDLSDPLFEDRSQMASCDPRLGKYLACSLSYRGDLVPRDIVSYLSTLKQKRSVQFADWCPTGFKVSLSSAPLPFVPEGNLARIKRSCSMISNTTAITDVFGQITDKFDRMYSKNAFIHWFMMEGMECGEFSEAREAMSVIKKDYQQAEALTIDQQGQ